MTNATPDPQLTNLLDRLGAAERDAAPADLERRVLEATRPVPDHARRPDAVVARIGFHRRPAFRIAAAAAIVAGAGLVVTLATRPSAGPAPTTVADVPTDELISGIERDLDDWLAEASRTPAPEPIADDLASLSGELVDAELILVDFWTLDDPLLTDPLALPLEDSL